MKKAKDTRKGEIGVETPPEIRKRNFQIENVIFSRRAM